MAPSHTVTAIVQCTVDLSWALLTTVVGVSVVLAAFVSATCVYNLCLHPLSSVPGPRYAAMSNLWLARHARDGRLAELGRTLHQQYGEAVRVGPNEVWFNSKAAFKAIYSAGNGYEKSDFYLSTVLQRPRIDWLLRVHPVDTLDLLTERDMGRYRRQRRLIGPVYRAANVIRHEKEVDKVMANAVWKLRSLDGGQIDLEEWMHMIAVECLGAVVLSWSPGMLNQGTDGGTGAHSYRSWRRKSVFGLFPAVAKLEMWSKQVGRLFSLIWGVNFVTPANFRPFFPNVNRRIARRLKTSRQGKATHEDLAMDLIRVHQEKTEFTETYLRKMIMTNFGAGHETMASTLISIMTMVGSHPNVQERLAEELQGIGKSPSYTNARGAPYLQAVIKESKRLHPVIAPALPRRVPASGLNLGGIHIPSGTTVGCSPVALHRNDDICGPRPHSFEPQRWMDGESRARDMDVFSLAWGGGVRSCPGRHLAEMVVWKVVATLLQEFNIEVDAPEDKQMRAYFLSIMTGVKARLVARRGHQTLAPE